MKNLFKLFGLFWMSCPVYAGVIYGVDQIPSSYQRVHYPAYVQIGSFSTMRTAERLQHQMHANTNAPNVIRSSNGQYKLIFGPFDNKASLKTFASTMAHDNGQQKLKQPPRNVVLQTPPHKAAPTIYAIQPHPRLEFSAFLGGSYIPNTIHGQTLQLLPYEIGPDADTYIKQSNARAVTWGVDAKYRFKLHEPSIQNYIFDSLGVGVDVFQITSFTQTGNVLQFNMPEFENYTYKLNLRNTRIMADFDLDLHSIGKHFIPFIEAGIGASNTTVSYNSAPIPPEDSPNLILPKKTSWSFSYQAGAGVKYVVNPHFALSLRYLYADLGKFNSSTAGSTTTLATPLTVTMRTQDILFGLTYSV